MSKQYLTDFTELLEQFDRSKNVLIDPSKLTIGSDKKVWWKCPEGPDHEWIVAVRFRIQCLPGGCPFCSGKKVSKTSLQTRYPELCKEWHPSRNGNLKPSELTYGRALKAQITNGKLHYILGQVSIRQVVHFVRGKKHRSQTHY